MFHHPRKPSLRQLSILMILAFACAGLIQPPTPTSARSAGEPQTKGKIGKPQPQPVTPNAPTAARLDSFTASGYDGGTLVEWRTGFEVDNLGFNLYRETAGRRTLITPQMLAGSALVTRQGTPLTAGKSYSWWDNAAAGKTVAAYWLEELNLKGVSVWHGPITAQRVGGLPSEKAKA